MAEHQGRKSSCCASSSTPTVPFLANNVRGKKRSLSPDGMSAGVRAASAVPYPKHSDSATPNGLDEDGNNDVQTSKKRRARPVLACTACKRRKIKCDRNAPCSNCISRGEASDCHWDSQLQPGRSEFAHSSEVEKLRERLEILENALRNNSANPMSICCPPSCTCHEDNLDIKREGMATAEDLPLSQLIDLKLGFKRSLETNPSPVGDIVNDGEARNTDDASVPTSSIWLDNRSPQSAILDPVARLPMLSYFGRDAFISIVSQSLPTKQVCDVLLAAYFRDFDWSCHTIHTQSFQREYDLFWSAEPSRRIDSADPAWLALLLIMLSLGVRCLSITDLPTYLPGCNLSQIQQWPELFFECSQLAIKAAQWTRKPQIRVLQTIILFLCYLDFTNEGPDTLIWIGAAVKIANLLDLHRLTNSSSTDAPDGNASQIVSARIEKQVASCLWLSLLSADMMASTIRQQPLCSSAFRGDNLKHLENCDDAELEAVPGPPPIGDDTRITDVSFVVVKYRLAVFQHQYLEAFLEARGDLGINEVTRLDASLRTVLDGIAEPAQPPGGPPFAAKVQRAVCRFHMIRSTVHYRLLRLHKPHMNRGNTEHAYRRSTVACVESAHAILGAIKGFQSASTAMNWFFVLHCIEAILVVFVDSFWKMDCETFHTTEVKRPDFSSARHLFDLAAKSLNPQVEQIARLGKSLLSKLMEEEGLRKSKPSSERESHIDVFKRVAAALGAPLQGESFSLASARAKNSGLTPPDSLAGLFSAHAQTAELFPAVSGTTDSQLLNDVFGDFNFDSTLFYQNF